MCRKEEETKLTVTQLGGQLGAWFYDKEVERKIVSSSFVSEVIGNMQITDTKKKLTVFWLVF